MQTLYNTEQIRELERLAIEEYKISATMLMQRAGKAAFKILRASWPRAKKIALICGKGNNGGDGYTLALLAHKAGFKVEVFFLNPPLSKEAKAAFLALKKARIKIEPFAAEKLKNFQLIVDALLGIGIKGEVAKEYQKAIEFINSCKIPILSLDVPSGLDANTGNTLGSCVHADITATFIGGKQGLFTGKAKEFCGEVKCDDLNLPKEIFAKITSKTCLLDYTTLARELLPKRSKAAHKGEFGHVVVIGGDFGMPGAVRMSAEAAQRVGAGLVSVITRMQHTAIVMSNRPELMCFGVEKLNDLDSLLKRASHIVIGPGLGKSDWGKNLFDSILKTALPLLIDADALNFLAENPAKRENWILTPHPGEAARLLKTTSQEVQKDRFTAARSIQKKYGGVCVLKGAGTLICDKNGFIGVCAAGNPGMASGGMGDILSGVIGGLLAQGLSISDAAKLGVVLHAAAGDEAAKDGGERGLLATDLLLYLRRLSNPQN